MDELTVKLQESLRAVLSLVDDNTLVRNTEEDSNRRSFLTQGLYLVCILASAHTALAEADKQSRR